MAGLRDILRAIGSLPRRLEGAMYEEEPIFRPRRNTGSMRIPGIGGEDEEFTPDTGEMEEVGKRRTGRPSKFGSFVQNQLPEMIRAGVVAAGSPTPGAVGTAQDIFGALKAVGDDRSRRDMLRYQMERQSEEDAMKRAEFEQSSRLNDARIKDYEAQAQRQAALANAPAPKSKYEMIMDAMRTPLPDGRMPTFDEASSIVMGSWNPNIGVGARSKAQADAMEKREKLAKGRAEEGFNIFKQREDYKQNIWEKREKQKAEQPKPQQQTKVTAADRKQSRYEKISSVANALLQEADGDRTKAAAAAVKDKRAQGLVKEVQDYLVPPQKVGGKSKAADDDAALIEALTGKKATPAKADPLGVR